MTGSGPLRVGIVALDSAPGGAGGVDLYTRRLVDALADHADLGELRVEVLVWQEARRAWEDRSWPPHVSFRVLRWTEQPLPLARRLGRALGRRAGLRLCPVEGEQFVARQVDDLNLDVLHFPRTLMYPRPVRTPSLLTFFDIQHEYYPEFFTRRELEERRRRYRPAAEAATHLHVPSAFARATLREKYDIPDRRMTAIPVGLGAEFRRRPAEAVRDVRGRYALPESFIVFPANPWPHKNHGRLMAALRSLRDAQGDCPPLVVFGRLHGETRDYASLAQAAGVEERVLDLGFVPGADLPALYSAATLMVFPSLFEGFGIPLLEAMACDCPIAAARAASIPEVVGDAALLFDPLDVPAMAAAIHALWVGPDARAELVRRGRQAIERFAWAAVLPEMAALYRSVATLGRPRGGCGRS